MEWSLNLKWLCFTRTKSIPDVKLLSSPPANRNSIAQALADRWFSVSDFSVLFSLQVVTTQWCHDHSLTGASPQSPGNCPMEARCQPSVFFAFPSSFMNSDQESHMDQNKWISFTAVIKEHFVFMKRLFIQVSFCRQKESPWFKITRWLGQK